MAKIKFEYLGHYHDANGKPLRARLFGHIGTLNRLGSGSLAPLSNAVLNSGVTRSLLNSTMGISRERSLPTLARIPLPSWFKRRKKQPSREPAPLAMPQVALFHDPFTNYNTPEVGIAAVELLEAAGFEVLWPEHKDASPWQKRASPSSAWSPAACSPYAMIISFSCRMTSGCVW
jgi:hypothetical protein